MDILGKDLLEFTGNKGQVKGNSPVKKTAILATLAGAYIAFGFILYLRVLSQWDHAIAGLVGAMLFPIGLLLIVVGGGELFTGNILDLGVSLFLKKISVGQLLKNWGIVLLFNTIGAVLVAYLYGDLLGFTDSMIANGVLPAAIGTKVDPTALEMVVSGFFCNILVTLGIWLSNSSKSNAGKMLLLWIPIAAFVYMGLQHSVANIFLLACGVFGGEITLFTMVHNLFFVILGNIIGGAGVVGGLYALAYNE